jgi:hypothetical protein
LNLRPPGYETSRSRRCGTRLAHLSRPGCAEISVGQLRWVQNGYKIRVSSGNKYPRFESDLAGGTRHCANQLRLSTAPIDIV